MEERDNELELALTELEKLVREFVAMQKITLMNKQGKIKLSDEKMKKLEQKYINLVKKMDNLNKKIKLLKNN